MRNIIESGTMELVRAGFILMLCAGVVLSWATSNPFFHALIAVGIVGLIVSVCIFTFSEENSNI